jgi:tRNA(Arg) A34 adenosine deaminase TadA
MKLSDKQIKLLKELMTNSAKKGNLANAGLVLDGNKMLASAESWVVTNSDATAHSERMLVEKVGGIMKTNYTPGLSMITVVEPCLMCMSACSQAGYKEIGYIIPASKYVKKIAWMTDVNESVDKKEIARSFSEPIQLVHLSEYEKEFCEVFEQVMKSLLE